MSIVDIIGYVCTIFLMISFAVKGPKNIRIFNCIGSAFYVVYGILLNSISVLVLNVFLVGLHGVELAKIAKKDKLAKNKDNTKENTTILDGSEQVKTVRISDFIFLIALTAVFPVVFLLGMPEVEGLGLYANGLMIYGFFQTDELRIRMFCFPSAAAYLVYSILIGAIPMIVSNMIMCIIHIVKLVPYIKDKSGSPVKKRLGRTA